MFDVQVGVVSIDTSSISVPSAHMHKYNSSKGLGESPYGQNKIYNPCCLPLLGEFRGVNHYTVGNQELV